MEENLNNYIFGFLVWIYKLMLFFMAKYCTIIAVNKLIYLKNFFGTSFSN